MAGRKPRLLTHGLFVIVLAAAWASPAGAIPAFARKYGLRCTTCHESWPVLNDFGRAFRDNGYQLRLGKDDTVTANPGYWPVAVHITPHYEFNSVTNQDTDQGLQTLKTGGIADAAIDLLMAGTLTKDISFLVVPTGFASDGAVSLESYWAAFSRPFFNSDWFNVRVGKHEVDLPASSHRALSLTKPYLVYSYHPGPASAGSAFDMGANQRGIEFNGHDRGSQTRYNVSIFSANDTPGSGHALDSPSFYGHFQKYVPLDSDSVSQLEFGLFGAIANYPTTFLTNSGEPIAGTGGSLRSSTRYGAEVQAWFGHAVAPLHVNLVLAHGSDDQDLYGGAADRNGTWNGGFLEVIWVPATELLHWGVFGRYDLIRNQDQPVPGSPKNLNDQDQITAGVRYTFAYTNRDEVGLHFEYSTNLAKGVASDGSNVRSSTLFFGVDFLY
jgi:hypothetical protein